MATAKKKKKVEKKSSSIKSEVGAVSVNLTPQNEESLLLFKEEKLKAVEGITIKFEGEIFVSPLDVSDCFIEELIADGEYTDWEEEYDRKLTQVFSSPENFTQAIRKCFSNFSDVLDSVDTEGITYSNIRVTKGKK